VCAQGEASDQKSTLLPVARYLTEVGTKQYKQGYFIEAEKTLLQAQTYEQYLSAGEREKLNKTLQSAHDGAVGRKAALQDKRAAEQLCAQGKRAEAQPYVSRIKNSQYLTNKERDQVAKMLDQKQPAKSGSLLSKLPLIGQDPAAREVTTDDPKPVTEKTDVASEADKAIEAAEATQEQAETSSSYIETIKRKRRVLRSHVKAVVNDVRVRTGANIDAGQFDKAQDDVEKARFLVENSRLHLGKELTELYTERLDSLAQRVAAARQEGAWQEDQRRRKAALDDQTRLQTEQDIEKRRALIEYMQRAHQYVYEMRYEAALGQVEALLAREPLHDEALALKSELEDIIFLRREREMEEEAAKEKAELSLRVQESMTPRAEDLNYSKKWAEIDAKRIPDPTISLDPANEPVYRQLEQIVDLSELQPEVSASEGFDIIRNVVDPPLNIVVLWKDLLDMGDIEPTTPIDMDGLPEIKLGTAFESLLQALGGGFTQLDYMVESGVIKVGTVGAIPKKLVTRIYDVSDLILHGQMPQMRMMDFMTPRMNLMQAQMGLMQSSSYAQMVTQGYTGGLTSGGGVGGQGGGLGGQGGGMMGGSMGGMMGGGGGGGFGGQGGTQGIGGTGGAGGTGIQDMTGLTRVIQEVIEPESWYELSDLGEGTITAYPQGQRPTKLAIMQTREIHQKIETLLADLRKAIGPQVGVEARFLAVSKNFLEDIGLDVDFVYNGLSKKWGTVTVDQDSFLGTKAQPTDVPGSLGSIATALGASGGYGTILDTLQVAFLLRATQGRADAVTLSEPRATVMNSEAAIFNMGNNLLHALPPATQAGVTQGGLGQQTTTSAITPQLLTINTGSNLSILPTITKDKKHVMLSIDMVRNQLLGINTQVVSAPIVSGTNPAQILEYPVDLPQTESVALSTRVVVPDEGTLILGGQKITAEMDKEVGVPILGKIPILGTLFSNSSKVRDEKILLLLVKPTIILTDERDREALASQQPVEEM